MVFGANEILHANQSSTSCGVALNELARSSAVYLDSDGRCMTCDQSVSAFIKPDKFLLSLKSGEMYHNLFLLAAFLFAYLMTVATSRRSLFRKLALV